MWRPEKSVALYIAAIATGRDKFVGIFFIGGKVILAPCDASRLTSLPKKSRAWKLQRRHLRCGAQGGGGASLLLVFDETTRKVDGVVPCSDCHYEGQVLWHLLHGRHCGFGALRRSAAVFCLASLPKKSGAWELQRLPLIVSIASALWGAWSWRLSARPLLLVFDVTTRKVDGVAHCSDCCSDCFWEGQVRWYLLCERQTVSGAWRRTAAAGV